jgi:hypothetical protein
MNDPFERIKKIKSGALDAERPSYEELTAWLQRIPSAWLPGLLIRVVVMSMEKKVFTTNQGLAKYVQNIVTKWKDGGINFR